MRRSEPLGPSVLNRHYAESRDEDAPEARIDHAVSVLRNNGLGWETRGSVNQAHDAYPVVPVSVVDPWGKPGGKRPFRSRICDLNGGLTMVMVKAW